MLRKKGFSAWVECNGKLQTYGVTHGSDNMTSGWIISEDGKPFSVHWSQEGQTRTASRGDVFLDGNYASGRVLFGKKGDIARCSTTRTASNQDRQYIFSNVEYTNDLTPDTMLMRKPVGTIRIDIERVRLRKEKAKPFHSKPWMDAKPKVSSDIADDKYAPVHCVSFGPPRQGSFSEEAWGCRPYNRRDPQPYASFIFKYRSRDALERLGITPSSEANPKDTPHGDRNIDSLQSGSKARARKLSGAQSPLPKKRVKQEATEGAAAISNSGGKGAPIEVIDLTGDSD